jgi:hypothetical protein
MSEHDIKDEENIVIKRVSVSAKRINEEKIF